MDSLIALLVFVTVFGCIAKIAAKAGYPPLYSLLLLVPFVNLVALVWFAFAEWPLEDHAYRFRMREEEDELQDAGYLLKCWLRKAVRLERRGRIDEAIRLYEKIAATTSPENAELARAAIARLRESSTSFRAG